MEDQYYHHMDSSDDDSYLYVKKSSAGFVNSSTPKKTKPTKTSPTKCDKSSKTEFKKCPVCGIWCKGTMGLRMHAKLSHKDKSILPSDTSHSYGVFVENDQQQEESEIKSEQESSRDANLNSNEDSINFAPNNQSELFADGHGSSYSNNVLYEPAESSVESNDFCISNNNVEAEQTETFNKKYKKSHKISSTTYQFIECQECGALCSGLKGIKMHTNMVHKQEYKHSSDAVQNDSILGKNKQAKKSKIQSVQENDDHSVFNLGFEPELFNVDDLNGSDDMFSLEIESEGSSKRNANIKSKSTNSSDIKYKRCHKIKMFPSGNRFIKCRECGKRCLGVKGIKIHTNKVHKQEYKHSSDISQNEQQNESEIQSAQEYDDHSIFNLGSESGLFDEEDELNVPDDMLSCEIKSEGSSKSNAFNNSSTNIMSKPTNSSDITYKKSHKMISTHSKFIKCRKCGKLCSGLKGIKMHTNMVHKVQYKDTYTSQSDSMLEKKSSAASPKKKASIFQNNNFDISKSNIKAESTETSSNKRRKSQKKLSASNKIIKCRECGVLCSGLKGIRMHTNAVHKLGKNDSYTSQDGSMFQNQQEPGESKIKSEQQKDAHSNLLTNNSVGNLNLNMQPGMFGGVFPINNMVANVNLPTVQLLSVPGNQTVKILKFIPKNALPSDGVLEKNEPEQSAQANVVYPTLLSNNNFLNCNVNPGPGFSKDCSLSNILVPGNALKKNEPEKSAQANVVYPTLLSNNNFLNCNLSPQPGLFSKECSLSNTLVPGDANQQILVIPKFDYKSDSYRRWLRKFIYQSKQQKLPLSPIMCENIIRVLDDLSSAIGKPVTNPQVKKSEHYVFFRMYKILSKVMSEQMKYSLCGMQC